MRDITRFFTRYFWEEVYGTLLGSVLLLLVSLFFANFDHIFSLYNPLVQNVRDSHPGIMGVFQILLWPAAASTAISAAGSAVKVFYDIRERRKRPKNPPQNGGAPGSPDN